VREKRGGSIKSRLEKPLELRDSGDTGGASQGSNRYSQVRNQGLTSGLGGKASDEEELKKVLVRGPRENTREKGE